MNVLFGCVLMLDWFGGIYLRFCFGDSLFVYICCYIILCGVLVSFVLFSWLLDVVDFLLVYWCSSLLICFVRF